MKISKYEFNDEASALSKIAALPHSTDEDGNEYPTHSHSIVKLGHIVLEQPEFDEDGEITKEAVLSENYHLDVLWDLSDSTDEDGELIKADHPHGWKSASVELDSNGVHSFFGIDYLAHKM